MRPRTVHVAQLSKAGNCTIARKVLGCLIRRKVVVDSTGTRCAITETRAPVRSSGQRLAVFDSEKKNQETARPKKLC
jgi:hypothetical protein